MDHQLKSHSGGHYPGHQFLKVSILDVNNGGVYLLSIFISIVLHLSELSKPVIVRPACIISSWINVYFNFEVTNCLLNKGT